MSGANPDAIEPERRTPAVHARNCERLAELLERFASEQDLQAVWQAGIDIERLRTARAVRPLIAFLRDPNLYRREASAWALGFLFDYRAEPALAARLRDRNEALSVRAHAVESAGLYMLSTQHSTADRITQ